MSSKIQPVSLLMPLSFITLMDDQTSHHAIPERNTLVRAWLC